MQQEKHSNRILNHYLYFIRMHLSSDFGHEGLKFVFYGGIQGFMLGLSTQRGSSGSSGGLS